MATTYKLPNKYLEVSQAFFDFQYNKLTVCNRRHKYYYCRNKYSVALVQMTH